MLPYFLNTILSCFFIYIGTKNENKHRKINIWVIMAILIPCILAGVRDVTVGTDTSIYGVPFFTYALSNTFTWYMATAGGDPLYLILVYGLTRITNQVFWELFLIEFVILFFTYKAMKAYGLGKYIWIGFLVFHLMYYSFTLNLMRQFVCISIILYAFKFVKERKWKRYILLCIVLFFIQKTAIIGIVIYPIYHFSVNVDKTNHFWKEMIPYQKQIFEILIIIGSCFVILFANYWIVFLSQYFRAFEAQVDYLTGGFNIVWRNLFYMTPILILMIAYKKSIVKRNPDFEFFTLVMIIYIILWQLQGISRETYRISLYFGYFMVISIPEMLRRIKSNIDRKIVFMILLIIMCAFYYDYFVLNLYNSTYPYTSELLSIEP